MLAASCADADMSGSAGRSGERADSSGARTPVKHGFDNCPEGEPNCVFERPPASLSSGTSGDHTGGGGSTSETPPSQYACRERPQDVPDAGDDLCLACLLSRCCNANRAFFCLNKDALDSCYETHFTEIRRCFARQVEGSSEDAWSILSSCIAELQEDMGWPRFNDDGGGLDAYLPRSEHTYGLGLADVLECVGGDVFRASVAALSKNGRLVAVGAHSGEIVPVDLVAMFRNQWTVTGSLRSTPAELDQVLDLLARGTLRPVIEKVLPLEQAEEGHRLLEARQGYGKVVLAP